MVGIATSYRLDGPGFVYCQGQELFSSLKTIYTGCRTHTASCSKYTMILFLRVNFIRNTRVKIELSLCNHEGMHGTGIAPLMCNHDTKWRHMLDLMHWLLYP